MKNIIRKILRNNLFLLLYKKIFTIISKLPFKRNIIVFESFHGKQYSDSPKAIYEYLKENHPELKTIWSVDRRSTRLFKSLNLPYMKRFTLKWLFTMPLAKYWVNNVRFPVWLPKPKRTVYLQTWHGTPLKKLGLDIKEVQMPGTTTENYHKNFVSEAAKWDYLISPNSYSTEIFRRAFDYKNKILETGYPRNDFLYSNNNPQFIRSFKEKHNLPLGKRVILYAPTWRDDEYIEKGKYKFKINFDLNQLKEELSDEYILIIRFHYLVADKIDVSKYEGFVYNFSDYEDIRDLYLISDLLITDYSSVFFDFANLKKPIIFYVYDIEKYRDKLRGFYFDLEREAPGPIVKTTEELLDTIREKTFLNYMTNLKNFNKKFCEWEDGNATKRVVEAVFLNNDMDNML